MREERCLGIGSHDSLIMGIMIRLGMGKVVPKSLKKKKVYRGDKILNNKFHCYDSHLPMDMETILKTDLLSYLRSISVSMSS